LVGDVFFRGWHTGLTNGKRSVTVLPIKRLVFPPLGFDPFGGGGFDFFDQFGQPYFPAQAKQDVEVVFGAVDGQRRAIQRAKNGREVWVQFGFNFRPDERLAVLGAKNQMDENTRQGLWHERGSNHEKRKYCPNVRSPTDL